MSKVGTYLNFPRQTEEAFMFYKSVFGGEFCGDIYRFGDIPMQEGMPLVAEADKNLVMHIALPILDDHLLMGTDAPESMGNQVEVGNNMHIYLELDSREEVDRLFMALSEGGEITMPLEDTFWNAYY